MGGSDSEEGKDLPLRGGALLTSAPFTHASSSAGVSGNTSVDIVDSGDAIAVSPAGPAESDAQDLFERTGVVPYTAVSESAAEDGAEGPFSSDITAQPREIGHDRKEFGRRASGCGGLGAGGGPGNETVRVNESVGGDTEAGVNDVDVTESGAKSSMKGTYNLMLNSIIGAGIIGLPFAMSECGLILGFSLLMIIGVLTDYSIGILVISGKITGKESYEALARHCFGPAGHFIIALAMFSFAYGAMIAYTIIIGDTIPAVLRLIFGHGSPGRVVVILFCSVTVLLPLSLYRDVSKLSSTSFLSLIAVFFIVMIVSIAGLEEARTDLPVYPFAPNFLSAVGAIAFAFVCHHNTFLLYRSLRDGTVRKFRKVTHYGVSSAVLASSTLGLCGFLAFRAETKGNVLNNFSDDNGAAAAARFLLAVTMFLTYPIELFVCRETIQEFLALYHNPSFQHRLPNAFHIGITVSLCATTTLLGVLVTNLGSVLELTGGFSAVVLGFVMPGAVFAKCAEGPLHSKKKAPAVALVLVGVAVAVASTSLTVKRIATGEQRGE